MRLHAMLTALVLMTVASTASADVWTIGSPRETGSWGQTFAFGGWGVEFDTVMIVAEPGTELSESGITDFVGISGSADGWAMDALNREVAIASGPAVEGVLAATFHFEGHFATDPVGINIVTLREGEIVEAILAEWAPSPLSSGFWTLTPGTIDEEDVDGIMNAMVPLPAPVAMAGIGLIGVVLARKRLRP